MGIGVRFYVWDENKGFKKHSMKGFDNSFRGLPNTDLIEYAGKRVKFVLVYLELENRKPIEIVRIEREMLTVDDDGKFNQDELHETMRLSMQTLDTPEYTRWLDDADSNVIWSSGIFAKRKLKDLYSWELSDDQLDQLSRAIFKVG